MKIFCQLLVYLLISAVCLGQSLTWSGADLIGQSTDAGSSIGGDVVFDKLNNYYQTGIFSGSLTIGDKVYKSQGSFDVFLVKKNSVGAIIWVMVGGGVDAELNTKLAVDQQGNVWLAGTSASSRLKFGSVLSNSTKDVFIAKFNSSGACLAVERGGVDVGSDKNFVSSSVTDIKIDGSGNAYLLMYYKGNATYGTTSYFALATNAVVAKINEDVKWQWASTASTSTDYETCYGWGLAVDNDGNSYITGDVTAYDYAKGAKFGDIRLTSGISGSNIFLAKLSPAGLFLWAKSIGNVHGEDSGNDIAIAADGNLLLAGSFTNDLKIAASVIKNNGARDALVAKFDANGENIWVSSYGGVGYESIDRLATKDDFLFVEGRYNSNIVLGPDEISGGGVSNHFVAQLHSFSGQALSALGYHSTHITAVGGMSIDKSNQLYITGGCGTTTTFGNYVVNGKSWGNNGFLAKVAGASKPLSIISNKHDSTMKNYVWPNPSSKQNILHITGVPVGQQVEVLDMQGRLLVLVKVQSDKTLPVSLEAGTYILKTLTGQLRLIIQ